MGDVWLFFIFVDKNVNIFYVGLVLFKIVVKRYRSRIYEVLYVFLKVNYVYKISVFNFIMFL